MGAGWVLAAASTIVKVLSCEASDQQTVVSRATPPAFPVSPYYSYWDNGVQFYNPMVFDAKPTLDIAYVNQGQHTIKEIAFGLYVDDKLIAKVHDSGRFSPNAQINHELKLKPNIFPLPAGTVHCVPLEITYEDGTKQSYNSTLRKSRSSDAK
jgi:hypothetical protein